MQKPLCSLLVLTLTSAASYAATVDFNNVADLSTQFSIAINNDGTGEPIPAVNASSGGINNTGAIVGTDHLSTQAIIYNSGFTLEENSTYTVSAYFKGAAYNGVGFTNGTSPNMAFLPEVSLSYIGSTSDDLYITNYSIADGEDWNDSTGTQASYDPTEWIFRSLSLTYTGLGVFEVSYATYISDENGLLGLLADSGIATYVNEDLSGTLYAFIFRDQSTLTDMSIDDFTAVVPEPSSYAALVALSVLTLVWYRRRSR